MVVDGALIPEVIYEHFWLIILWSYALLVLSTYYIPDTLELLLLIFLCFTIAPPECCCRSSGSGPAIGGRLPVNMIYFWLIMLEGWWDKSVMLLFRWFTIIAYFLVSWTADRFLYDWLTCSFFLFTIVISPGSCLDILTLESVYEKFLTDWGTVGDPELLTPSKS